MLCTTIYSVYFQSFVHGAKKNLYLLLIVTTKCIYSALVLQQLAQTVVPLFERVTILYDSFIFNTSNIQINSTTKQSKIKQRQKSNKNNDKDKKQNKNK